MKKMQFSFFVFKKCNEILGSLRFSVYFVPDHRNEIECTDPPKTSERQKFDIFPIEKPQILRALVQTIWPWQPGGRHLCTPVLQLCKLKNEIWIKITDMCFDCADLLSYITNRNAIM